MTRAHDRTGQDWRGRKDVCVADGGDEDGKRYIICDMLLLWVVHTIHRFKKIGRRRFQISTGSTDVECLQKVSESSLSVNGSIRHIFSVRTMRPLEGDVRDYSGVIFVRQPLPTTTKSVFVWGRSNCVVVGGGDQCF